MSAFIDSTLCFGRRPDGLVSRRHLHRPGLVSRLLKDRSSPRFIVAPPGFGKTTLAYEYAETVFSFEGVYWVDGKDPCFLRDLDAGSLKPSNTYTYQRCLVVLDDLPKLEEGRRRAFYELLRELSSQGVESMVLATPCCAPWFSESTYGTTVSARELLLDAEELSSDFVGDSGFPPLSKPLPPQESIAVLRWANQGRELFLKGLRTEELPLRLRALLVCLLLSGSGELSRIAGLLPSEKCETDLDFLREYYPYLGIEGKSDAFTTVDFTVDELVPVVDEAFTLMIKQDAYRDRDELLSFLADGLLAHGNGKRACELVHKLFSRRGASRWFGFRGWDLMAKGCLNEACELYHDAGHSSEEGQSSFTVLYAWLAALLGDEKSAAFQARRVILDNNARKEDRLLACLVAMRWGSNDHRQLATRVADKLIDDAGVMGSSPYEEAAEATRRFQPWYRPLYYIQFALEGGASAGLLAWVEACNAISASEGLASQPSVGSTLWLAAAWVITGCLEEWGGFIYPERSRSEPFYVESDHSKPIRDESPQRHPCQFSESDAQAIRCLASYVRQSMEHHSSSPHLFCLDAASLLLTASQSLSCFPDPSFSAAQMWLLRCHEKAMAVRRDTYLCNRIQRDRQAEEHYATHPSLSRQPNQNGRSPVPYSSTTVPSLYVSLFGGLEVRVGESIVPLQTLSRHKTKTLLALLVLNRGKEYTRDNLIGQLWPGSSRDNGRKNLYTIWSELKHAVTVDGSCPYLIRDQFGIRLDGKLVSSDIPQFENLCRTLMFGNTRAIDWERAYRLVVETYREDLMPSELENEVIGAARVAFRLQITDALVAASRRLSHEGDALGALWFAREALRRDDTREDAYAAQMKAQIACGQHNAALDTFFRCQRYLKDELGIDPSPEIASLYHGIIEAETV